MVKETYCKEHNCDELVQIGGVCMCDVMKTNVKNVNCFKFEKFPENSRDNL